LPSVRDKVSVEVSSGRAWEFGQHRTLVITKPPEPYFPVEGLSNFEPARTQALVSMILDWLAVNPQVCSDDIYDKARKLFPDADPRFIGHGFRVLSHGKRIHQVGYRKSSRAQVNHTRPVAVWEATKE
jgi:hypothetical protein